jgi:CDP-glycerol glycerophosphotransferase
MALISVVIPVHGVGDYLDQCLDSVLAEPAVPGLEVIAVDDASPDRCAAILAARPDPRLRVITTPVALGPGPARELGAKEATGEYVWFVDGDDELAPGALRAVAGALRRLHPDMLIVDFESLRPDGSTRPSGGAAYLAGLGGEVTTLAEHPALIHLTMTAWSKVFRRDFLAGLGVSFAGRAPHEDVPVTAAALLGAARIGIVPRVCYRYRRARRGSYLAAASEGNFNIFGAYQQIFNLLSERSVVAPALPARVRAAIFERAIWHYTTLLPLVPSRRRREFFHRMSADFRRWRPAGFRFPAGLRGIKFRLVARDAYRTYSGLDALNRWRLAARVR